MLLHAGCMQPNARQSLIRRARQHTTVFIAAAGLGTAAVATVAYAASVQASPSTEQGSDGDQDRQNPGNATGGDDEDNAPRLGIFGLQLSPGGSSDGGSHSS